MGIMDAFEKEDRVQIKITTLYGMLREAAKAELIMNAVNCNMPHQFIREMVTGEKEKMGLPDLVVPMEFVRELFLEMCEKEDNDEDSDSDKPDVEEDPDD